MNEINDNILEVKKSDKLLEKGDLNTIRDTLTTREHSNTMISKKERDIIKNIKKKNEEGQKTAIRKLVVVSIICILFMVVELVGNYLSGSLAILSDALHMLCDFSGFAISMASIIISKRKPTKKMSFGYHRAEVVGAMLSILVIWVLTGWLIYEGVEKLRKDEIELNATIMLIVAIIGLISNILMGHILHSAVYNNKLGTSWS